MHAMVNDFCQLNGQIVIMQYSKYSVMFARYYRVSFTLRAIRVWGQNLVVQAVQVHRIYNPGLRENLRFLHNIQFERAQRVQVASARQ